ncbi:hypothetical protein [Paenibacillus mendelii]|uniref:Copper amine oxidase-like N-terminal domain-containing protein n=1 Tax=Paenibacillus mendelii TaxID=206163 RepID=A0ABV6JDF3_9BACL|nr:hypothetical protein [Paenibacillus mendelii]MCQ6563611.1 hypothetical protein [Paenibacillus mendelii]
MNMNFQWVNQHAKRWISTAVISPILLISITIALIVNPVQVEAAGQSDSISSSWSYSNAYQDPDTGITLVNVYNMGANRILMLDADGVWSKLPSHYNQMWYVTGLSRIAINPSYNIARMEFDTLYFDFERKAIVSGGLYMTSPGYAYGTRKESPYTFPPNSAMLIKNNHSGVIREMDVTRFDYRHLQWLQDGTFITYRFNEEAKENEIVIGNPDTGTIQRLMLGTIRRVNAETNLLAYVKNEPERIWYVHDLTTGKERKLSSESEKSSLFPESIQADPKPPGKLTLPDVDQLPEYKPAFEYENEAVLKVNGQQYTLPYAFISGTSVFIPVRPLLSDLGIELTTTKTQQTSSYTLRRGNAALTLTSTEVRIYSDRLFITTDHLQKLGVSNPAVEWIK